MRVMMDFDLSVQKLRQCLCSEVLIGHSPARGLKRNGSCGTRISTRPQGRREPREIHQNSIWERCTYTVANPRHERIIRGPLT